MKMDDLVVKLISYENGEMSSNNILKLYSELISTRRIHIMQGHYGRVANLLIEDSYLDGNGKILKEVE